MNIVSGCARLTGAGLIITCSLLSVTAAWANPQGTGINARDERGVTPLERAVTEGDTNAVAALIQRGVDVNAKSHTGRTALSWAAFQGRLEIVRALARAGADLNVRDEQGWTPLSLAFEAGHFTVVKALVDAGADVNRDQLRKDVNARGASGQTPLERASSHDDIDSLRALMQLGADPNAPDISGRTLLFGGRLEVVRAMIAGRADVNLKDKQGWTALTLAAIGGNAAIVQALIEAGADVNAEGRNGSDALMNAAYFGHLETVHVLLKAANVNHRTSEGITALMLARWSCHRDVVEALTRAGAVTRPEEWKREPRFEDFPVSRIYKAVPAPVDLHSNPEAPTYRTRLRAGARKGPNFAGHYTTVSWGCGSNCESTMIVDAVTGRVFGGIGDERGAEFKLGSNLAIADPGGGPGATGYTDNPTDSLPVRYYLWENNKFRLIFEEVCSVKDGHQRCGCEDLSESATPGLK